jgi:ABC-type polysaccharide/polyol phosphate export permease
LSPLSNALRVIVALTSLLFLLAFLVSFGALTLSHVFMGFGLLSFFALAFCALTASGLESTQASARAKKYYSASKILGNTAIFFFVLSEVIYITRDNPNPAIPLMVYLPLLLFLAVTIGKQAFALVTKSHSNQ